jgi:hypothetical protein
MRNEYWGSAEPLNAALQLHLACCVLAPNGTCGKAENKEIVFRKLREVILSLHGTTGIFGKARGKSLLQSLEIAQLPEDK